LEHFWGPNWRANTWPFNASKICNNVPSGQNFDQGAMELRNVEVPRRSRLVKLQGAVLATDCLKRENSYWNQRKWTMWAQSYRTVFDFKMLKVKMNANKFTPIFYYRLRSWGLYFWIWNCKDQNHSRNHWYYFCSQLIIAMTLC